MVHLRCTLGQRIVDAARMALVLDLRQDQHEETQRRQDGTGGAGSRSTRDGTLAATDDRLWRSPIIVEGGAE